MPQDRLIFNYDYFNNVPLAPGGINVNRFSAGFEKTFFDGNFSVELLVPFATTLDNNINASYDEGLGTTNLNAVELGNVLIWTKGLVYKNETCAISAGLGIEVPTAPDTTVNIVSPPADGGSTALYEIRNRSAHLLPFIGSVWTPTSKFFVQQFLQFDIDTVGNKVLENDGNDLSPNYGDLVPDGRLHAAPFAYYDLSLGYWLFHDQPCSGRFLTGLATIFEVHYNQALARSNSVTIDSSAFDTPVNGWEAIGPSQYVTPSGSVLLGGDPIFSSVNLTTGVTAEIADNATLSVGYTFPLSGGLGREFSNQLQVYFNYYFGRSTKDYRVGPASAPSTL
jgi:hypothetical protein